MYRDPPWVNTIPRLWLPPKVWFHGSQSSSTGGSLARKGIDWISMTALLQHMRLVVMTALGCPVDPDVSRNLTIEFLSVAACASATRAASSCASESSVDTGRSDNGASPMISTLEAMHDSARAKRGVSKAATSPG